MKFNLKIIKKNLLVSIAIVGSFASVIGLMSTINSDKLSNYGIGILASIIGALIASIILNFLTKRKKIRKIAFISYSSMDKNFVRKLSEDLHEYSIEVFIDQKDINVGDSLKEKLEDIISKSNFFITVISKNSVKSRWLMEELRIAEEQKKRVLPVVIDDLNEAEIPSPLQFLVYADFKKDYDSGLNLLVRAIEET